MTISPDPKVKIVKKTYGTMSPLKQYQNLEFNIRRILNGLRKSLVNWYFIFEISGSGNIHAHGTITVNDTSDNMHMLHIKTFQTRIAQCYAPRAKNQFMLDVCCKIKKRDDGIISESYKTWEDYLQKHQKNLPKWMKPIEKGDSHQVSWEEQTEEREIAQQKFYLYDLSSLDDNTGDFE